MFSFVSSLFRSTDKTAVRRRGGVRKPRYRPVLEGLEERAVPALLASELAAALHMPLPTVAIAGAANFGGGITHQTSGGQTSGGQASAFVYGIAHHTSSVKNPYVLLGIRSTNAAALQAFINSRPEHAHHPHLGPFTFTNSIGDTYQIFTHTDFVVRIPAGVTQAQAQKMGLVPSASFFTSLGVSVSPSSLHH